MRVFLTGLLFSAVAVAQLENAVVGSIDFFALGGLDARRLQREVTVRPGDRLVWPATPDRLRDELSKLAGRPFTHFAPVCCDKSGRWMLYIGFGEKTVESFRPRPAGEARLAPQLVALYDEFMGLLPESLKQQAGRADDYSKGYSLGLWPPMREVQLRLREAAVAHEAEVLAVLGGSADDKHRIAAAHLAGYTRQSADQIRALSDAARDPNGSVRNNAVRALGVLAATPAFARQIPVEPFISKLNSPVWSDRNKGLMLLTFLTKDRESRSLARIREEALPALIEMSQWQFQPHAAGPIRILGRIAGLPEAELDRLAESGDAGTVLRAIARLQESSASH